MRIYPDDFRRVVLAGRELACRLETAFYIGRSSLFCRAVEFSRLRVSFPRFKGIFVKPKIELTSVIQALAVAEHLSFRRAADAL
ncbi:MAG: hypothetical protein ACREC0_08730, partial [Methylocella sp.]